MDANEFIGKLKANNTAKDQSDLDKVYEEYKVILCQLPAKDRASFSLNVLCVLCRNLDKAPKWRDSIDNKALLVLSIDCVRETRAMEKADRVKTLACVYHLHRHVVRQNSSVAPELILKISFMPFEVEAKYLLSEYAKTYWNILVDRLSYIERLRNKIPIIKLLPKIAEDALKIIEIYDTVQFCSNIIVFLIKKLHFLYTEKYSKDLNQIYREVFKKISEKDLKVFKKLPEKDVLDIYVKLNESLYVIAENASRMYFKDSTFDNAVRTCISIVGHRPDLFHCLQTFYSNAFCSILTSQTHLSYTETVLSGLLISIETTEKLGYIKAMIATYPYLSQFLRLYIEYNINNCNKKPWKDSFNVEIQEICLKIVQLLMRKLKSCSQLLKCEGCEVKTGLHDSLRLSFLVKNFLTISITQNILVTDTFPHIHDIILKQYEVLTNLNELGCVNYEKCFRKLQTDIHNTAIILNKAQYYEFSVKLFNIYLNYEMKTSERKNISRALYNKSICELDSQLYEDALIDAFLSLVYAEGLSSDKYMSLVMDIKAKELKNDGENKNEDLQMLTVVDACEKAVERKLYGDIKLFLMDLKFSELLKHEFSLYAKLWPSVTPIGGVWRALLELSRGKYTFTDADATWSLYEVITETPSVVRTITNDHLNTVLTELLETTNKGLTPDMKIVRSTLLFLKTEFELAAASKDNFWKSTEPVQNLDLEKMPSNRTIPQEFDATKPAIKAVELLTELSPDFNKLTKTKCLRNSLRIYEVFVQLLLHLSRDLEAMQLAYICCRIAECLDDKSVYVRCYGVLLQLGGSHHKLRDMMQTAAGACAQLHTNVTAVYLCDASMYYSRVGSLGAAARLVQLAQAQLLAAMTDDTDDNLDLALGRLLEAQCALSAPGTDALTAANRAQRHYLAIGTAGTKWLDRRLHSLTVRVRCHRASVVACGVARSLLAWRRARATAAAAHCSGAAAARAALCALVTDASCFRDAQMKIDHRLKYVLGLHPSAQPRNEDTSQKQEAFTPRREIESMLECVMFKRSQTSPSLVCDSVPAFTAPPWFSHRQCACYACAMPACSLLACQTSGREAAMYFRANDIAIARNYFNGVLAMINSMEERITKNSLYEHFVVESVGRYYWDWLREVKVDVLIELSYFELKNGDYEVADEHIVEINQVLQEFSNKNVYVYNDVMNLMCCAARLRKSIKKPVDLESEFENLSISPLQSTENAKTPISKCKPPIITKLIVKDEEIPRRIRVIKLNLDVETDEEVKTEFKVPITLPATAKHVMEVATPIAKSARRNVTVTPKPRESRMVATRSQLDAKLDKFATPKILVTQPSDESSNTTVYSTPKDLTPDQFFTPLTSVKTYTKKSLRHNLVKNLEQEFSTPSVNKQAFDTKSVAKDKATLQVPKKSSVKKTLKRAASPGKLCKEATDVPRNGRLRKPVQFSLDNNDDGDKR